MRQEQVKGGRAELHQGVVDILRVQIEIDGGQDAGVGLGMAGEQHEATAGGLPGGPTGMVDAPLVVLGPAAVEADAERDGMLAARYHVDHDGRTHASATAEWRVDPGVASPSLPALERDVGGRPFAWSQAVRSFELGPDGALRPAAVLQWFEYAVYRAAQLVGWTPSRMREADFVTLQIGHLLAIRARVETGEDLAIVSRIVQEHQGVIRVEDNRPRGARFVVELPA